jgi:hypothetical protein
MKRFLFALALALSFVSGVVVSAQVRDWHDIERVQKHVHEAIDELGRIRAANHFQMRGHGLKAQEHLQAAERELQLAIEAAREQ